MKLNILIILFFVSMCSMAQDYSNQIDSMKTQVVMLKSTFQLQSDSTINNWKEINLLPNKPLAEIFLVYQEPKKIILAVCNSDMILLSDIKANSIQVGRINKNDTVILLNYKDGYWLIKKGNLTGYISEIYIIENVYIMIFKAKNRLEEYERKKSEEFFNQEDYRKKIITQFGKSTCKKIIAGFYWIGMTNEMAMLSLGPPNNKNTSFGTWANSEEWVYDDITLYFENGKLESYQN